MRVIDIQSDVARHAVPKRLDLTNTVNQACRGIICIIALIPACLIQREKIFKFIRNGMPGYITELYA